jgi:outer membrane protein insertion porin family
LPLPRPTGNRKRGAPAAVLAWALVLAAAWPAPAPAQAPAAPSAGEKILRVEIRGLRHQPEARVKALLESREGRAFDKQVLSEDIHRLIQRGAFSHIEHKVETLPAGGVALVFTVVENDRVAEVRLAGVKSEDAKVLQEALRIKAGDYYDPAKVKRDLETLREIYREKGYPFVDVATLPPAPAPDGVAVRYSVAEGPKVVSAGARFTGPHTADDGVLEDQLRMRPPGWPMSWLSSTPFVEREARLDVERLKAWFRLEGWLDAEVTLADIEYAADKSSATVVFHVVEGPAYRVRRITLQGNALFPEEELRAAMTLRPGGPFTERDLAASVQAVLDKYRERAYILAQADVQRVYAKDVPEVDLLVDIRESGRVHLDRIVIQGNVKTRDDVIRRALSVAPGEAYNKVAFERGLRRLRDLQYFERVTYREDPGSGPDRRVLVVDVVEMPTGNVRFAAGYSSANGIVGHIGVTQRNFDLANLPESLGGIFSGDAFSGGGQILSLNFMPGTERTSADLSFYEPYTFGEPYGFSARFYRLRVHRSYGYLEDRLGTKVGIDRRLVDNRLKLSFATRIENIDISDVEADAPSDVFKVEGLNQIRSVIPAVSVDFRDSMLRPTEGGSAQLSTELAGAFLGGDFSFSKTRLEVDYHIPLYTTERKFRHVLSLGATAGWIGYKDTEDDVPIFERFYAGGGGSYGLRGFDYREVGPKENGEPIGGRGLVLGSAEYGFPIIEETLRGAVFVDVGDLERSFGEIELDRFRVSTGAGIRLAIPQMGGGVPLALYYCIPIRKMTGDDRQSLYFDMGFPF